MITAIVASVFIANQAKASIDSVFQRSLKDVSFSADIVRQVKSELRKISDDYAKSYVFDNIKIFAKEPFKMRLEASSEDTKVLYQINGTTQYYRIPKLRLNTRLDLTNKPGRRQTFMDFGIPTPSLFDDLFIAKFVRFDRETKDPIFDLTYPTRMDDTTRYRVWIDPDKKMVVKREWYGQEGQMRATLTYTNPVQVNGVWFPTTLIVKNAEDKFAAQTKYSEIKINSGLADSLFDFK